MNHDSDSDSNSPNTAESKYPSGKAQFPSRWFQSKFGDGGGSQFPSGGGGNVGGGLGGGNAGGGYGMVSGFGMGGSGSCFGSFPGGNQFPWGFPSLPGGYIPVPWPYSPFQGGGGGFGMGGSGGGVFGGFPGGNQFPGGFPSFPDGCIPVPWPNSPFQGGGGEFPSFSSGFGGANAGVGRPVGPRLPFGDNVYRPNMDRLDLGISSYRVENPQPAGRGTGTGDCRRQGKGVARESSQAAGQPKRTVYTSEESTALAKCWVSVVEDPVMSNNPTGDGLWNRICKSYEIIKPQGAKNHSPEELRKKWDRIKTSVSRFCGIYENNTRLMTNGRTMDDVKELSFRQYAQNGLFPLFKYWDAFLVLKDSPKFQEWRAAAFLKRMRLGVSGNYRSSDVSIDLNDDVEEEPPSTFSRRRRPQGQQSSIRDARASGSDAFASGSRSGLSAPVEVLDKNLNLQRTRMLTEVARAYESSTNPIAKGLYFDIMQRLRGQLGMTGALAGDGDGDGDGDEVADSDDATE